MEGGIGTSEETYIAGYRVHAAAAVFPLMEGDEFEMLVESIREHGIMHPIVVRRGPDATELIDGRNRLRAAEEARNRGVRVDVPVVEWGDDGRNVAEWVWDTNAIRRHLTDDGFAMASVAILPLIQKESAERQKANQFKKGQSGNPSGKKQARTISTEPAKRDTKAEDARSTVGKVAAKAGVSMHKARQAIAVQKAVDRGELSPETAKEVMTGRRKLKDAVAVAHARRERPLPLADVDPMTRVMKDQREQRKKHGPTKQSENARLERKVFQLVIALVKAVGKIEDNTDNKSPRREKIARELRRLATLADRLVPSGASA